MSLDSGFLESSWTWIQAIFHRSLVNVCGGSIKKKSILGRESGRIKARFMSQVCESVKCPLSREVTRLLCQERAPARGSCKAALSRAFSWKLGVSCCKLV